VFLRFKMFREVLLISKYQVNILLAISKLKRATLADAASGLATDTGTLVVVSAPDAMTTSVHRSAKQAIEVVSQSTRPIVAASDDDDDDYESDSEKMVICEEETNGNLV